MSAAQAQDSGDIILRFNSLNNAGITISVDYPTPAPQAAPQALAPASAQPLALPSIQPGWQSAPHRVQAIRPTGPLPMSATHPAQLVYGPNGIMANSQSMRPRGYPARLIMTTAVDVSFSLVLKILDWELNFRKLHFSLRTFANHNSIGPHRILFQSRLAATKPLRSTRICSATYLPSSMQDSMVHSPKVEAKPWSCQRLTPRPSVSLFIGSIAP
jgi:hypothetical protein